ncbi:hypothetical protein WMQ48_11560 [Vibrio cidicii]|uniref:hypothetical protein n=1 Tax=Vibrio cidicii TaxID=1763883 RepID=UPI0037529E75
MTYHLHLNFEKKEYFYSEQAWSTQETIQGLLLPISAHRCAEDKEVVSAIDEVKSLIDEVLIKVDVEWNDWMTQKPTIIYQDDVKSLISKLQKEFFINSFWAYFNGKKCTAQAKLSLEEEFLTELKQLEHEGTFIFKGVDN